MSFLTHLLRATPTSNGSFLLQRLSPSTARVQEVVTRLDLNGDGEVDFGQFEQFIKRQVYPDASFSGVLNLRTTRTYFAEM